MTYTSTFQHKYKDIPTHTHTDTMTYPLHAEVQGVVTDEGGFAWASWTSEHS